jgi:hypothetical protein
MLILFLAAFYGLGFYLLCAPIFWLALQFVPDRRQRQQALRALGTLGLGLLALLTLSFVPVESLSASVASLVGTRQAPISVSPSTEQADAYHAQQQLEKLRERYHLQALP